METYALITGASKGIGRSMAVLLAKKKYNLLLVARSEAELQNLKKDLELSGVKVEYLVTDLSTNDSPEQILKWCFGYPVSILINNAGYGLWGNFKDLSLDMQLNMMQLNVNNLVSLTHKLIPLLQKQPQSYILNVASTAAYQSVPTLGLYAASKAFVLSFTRALRFELKDERVSVSCLSPGPVATNFSSRAGMPVLGASAEKLNMTPDEVAKIALKGMFDKKAEIIPGAMNIISSFATRILPKALIEKVAAGIYKNL